MAETPVPLYERLPEIYRIRDEEGRPAGQLQAYLGLVEDAFGAVHENIRALYDDLFIETCDDWVIAYIADLLGTSHLAGDPWTLRADVADTIALRRRKGTLGAIELLTFNLTRWGVHCVELRENLVWHQHLNHQRPDQGGQPPYGLPGVTRHQVIRGGTATLRDPATLSLLNTPFDRFGHIPDLRPPAGNGIRTNLPNLAIFLWRLEAYRIGVSQPVFRSVEPNPTAAGDEAAFIARVVVHPTDEPLALFNSARYDPERRPPVLTKLDETPGAMARARLSDDAPAGNPAAYLAAEPYDATDPNLSDLEISDVGLQLHLPAAPFGGDDWRFRGANLCAWEDGLAPPLGNREIAVDPVIGRLAIGVNTAAEGAALEAGLRLTHTYGAVGPVGAHPISRASAPEIWAGEPVDLRIVNFHQDPNGLAGALSAIHNAPQPIVIEIQDSMTHDLDLASAAVGGTINEAGGANLRLNRSLIIRAASGERPVIRLRRPLRLRPTHVSGANAAEQAQFDAVMDHLTLRLEGLYLTRAAGFPANQPLIARAALHSLEVIGCTLDPGGHRQLDGSRAPLRDGVSLREPYGFNNAADETTFAQTPEVHVQRSVAGALLIDRGYRLYLTDSIIDGGRGVTDDPGTVFALSGASDPLAGWGPPTQVSGASFLGRTRVETLNGAGGIWVHGLEVLNNQTGCIKFSYFSGLGDRLPQNHGCLTASEAKLRFVSEIFGQAAYGQITRTSDRRIWENGPNNDLMGAFGFLLEAHKWRNLQIRYREFMPLGVRPLLIAVT
jgi:hypothetical protein